MIILAIFLAPKFSFSSIFFDMFLVSKVLLTLFCILLISYYFTFQLHSTAVQNQLSKRGETKSKCGELKSKRGETGCKPQSVASLSFLTASTSNSVGWICIHLWDDGYRHPILSSFWSFDAILVSFRVLEILFPAPGDSPPSTLILLDKLECISLLIVW